MKYINIWICWETWALCLTGGGEHLQLPDSPSHSSLSITSFLPGNSLLLFDLFSVWIRAGRLPLSLCFVTTHPAVPSVSVESTVCALHVFMHRSHNHTNLILKIPKVNCNYNTTTICWFPRANSLIISELSSIQPACGLSHSFSPTSACKQKQASTKHTLSA